jgi:hypothetical protein
MPWVPERRPVGTHAALLELDLDLRAAVGRTEHKTEHPTTRHGADAPSLARPSDGDELFAPFLDEVQMEIGTGSPIIHGIGFGLIVWATSNLGWIPMLGILPPAPEDQPGRRRIMLLVPPRVRRSARRGDWPRSRLSVRERR